MTHRLGGRRDFAVHCVHRPQRLFFCKVRSALSTVDIARTRPLPEFFLSLSRTSLSPLLPGRGHPLKQNKTIPIVALGAGRPPCLLHLTLSPKMSSRYEARAVVRPGRTNAIQNLLGELLADHLSLIIEGSRTHRRGPGSGRPHGSARTCHLEAHSQHACRLARASDALVCGALRRSAKRKIRKGWSVPIQEHCSKRQCRHN